jgi:hypothetical protein
MGTPQPVRDQEPQRRSPHHLRGKLISTTIIQRSQVRHALCAALRQFEDIDAASYLSSCLLSPLLSSATMSGPAVVVGPIKPSKPHDWNSVYDLVYQLYWIEDYTLENTMEAMRKDHNFYAT